MTGANMAAAALLIAAAFALIYAVVRESSYRHLDEDLRAEQAEVINNLDWAGDSIIVRNMPEWEEAEHAQLEANPTFLQIVDKKGQLVFKSANIKNARFRFQADSRVPLFYNGEEDGQRLRFGQFPLYSDAGHPAGQLTIAVSGEESHVVLHNLRQTLWGVYLFLVLFLFVLLWYAASLAIDPIRRLIEAVNRLDENELGDRLPVSQQVTETRHLGEAMNALLARLEVSVKQQKQFIADVSHELRTPLTAIKGMLEVALRKERTPAQYARKMEELLAQTNRLHRLYDDMLALARVEAGAVVPQKSHILLSECMEKAVAPLQPALAERGQTLSTHIPTPDAVYTDPALLRVVLNNLLSNAIKFGHPNSSIRLEWSPAGRTLAVRDEGPGIVAAHLPHIFDRFYRADDARSADTPGHGLGLSIVKKICDLLDVSIAVESTEGIGTTFLLRFPA